MCLGPNNEALRGFQDVDNWDENKGVFVDQILEASWVGEHEAATCNYGDPEFIAHSRDDVPWLLDQLTQERERRLAGTERRK